MKKKIITVILISIIIITNIYIGKPPVEAKQTEGIKSVEKNVKNKEKGSREVKEGEDAGAKVAGEKESQASQIGEQEKAGAGEKEEEQASKETEQETGAEKEGNKEETGKEEGEESSKREEWKEEENKQEEGEEKEEIYSSKYLVKEKTISRIPPQTSIEEFKKNIETESGKEIKIYKEEKEITKGNIGTGMKIKIGEKGDEYEASVIGDINRRRRSKPNRTNKNNKTHNRLKRMGTKRNRKRISRHNRRRKNKHNRRKQTNKLHSI